MQAFDCLTKLSCQFRIFKSALPADNPMQSELCSHIGSTGLKKCRCCDIGGNAEHIESSVGYHSLFSVCIVVFLFRSFNLNSYMIGALCNANSTHNKLLQQLKLATKGVKKRVADRQTLTEVKDKIVQVFINKIFCMSNGDDGNL